MKMFRPLLLLFLFSTKIYSQSLTFSSSGQTGLSGTNWSVSGSNPVKISSTGASSINTSVLQGPLSSGVDVIISSVGQMVINSDITKTNSGRLIIKSGINSISGTGKIILGNNAQLLINQGATISNNIELNSGTTTIGFAPIEVEYLIVAGGGSGGVGRGGGGGAGGVLTGSTEVSSGSYSIAIGAGGNAVTNDNRGINGSNSSAFNLPAIGGGGGGGWISGSETGLNGGSGGGASASPFSAGTGTAGQGNNGFSLNFYREPGGGGGGASSAAGSQNGGNGIISNITGNAIWYGGGGGAGAWSSGASLAGLGGNGGGGNGTKIVNGTASSGQANTGGGGGGSEGFNGVSGAGGSGIVVLRYLGADVSSADIEYAGSNLATGYQVNEFRQVGPRTFSINASLFQGVVSGQITGSGNLILNPGSGIIILTGVNSNSGSTTIESGRVQVGNNGTQGNLGSGNIENKSQLQFNRSNSLTISNIISGIGSITQQGTGSLIFTQNNTYSGSTTISSGSIQIGNNTSTGTLGTGNIINNSAIIVSRSNDLTLSNLISGTGTLTKELSNTLTLTQNNSYNGNTTINNGTLILQNDAPNPTSKTYLGIGQLRIQPSNASFTSTFSNLGWSFASTLTGLTFGKSTNTQNITIGLLINISGLFSVFGGSININENINTSSGGTNGDILLKASADINLPAAKTITTSGGDVILWANSDNAATNGSIALRNGSSITTGSNSIAGGSIWLGGGSDGATWNGLSVGSGYAVPGTLFTPSNGGGTLNSGIYLERNSISSFGGNIKIAGDAATGFAAIVTYGNTITINAGSGKIEMDGQATNTAAGNRMGILFGLHDNTVISTVNILSSSTSGDAITITGVGRGTEDAIGLSGTLNIIASGGGNIVMNGNALGTGRSIVAGNYYHGIMNVFANSGNITLNGNTKAVQVATPVIGGLTSGPSKINIGQGGSISSSSSDVFLTADNIALAAGGIAINSSGTVTIEPSGSSFTSALTFPIPSLSIANTISGLIIGKSTNSQNITFGSTTTIAGPIIVYGGLLTLNENLTSSNGSTISLFGNGLSIATGKTIASSGGQLIIAPQSASNTIGLAGATGTLSLPASYFSTNFSDGFSNIQIGRGSQTGNIAANTFTLRDNMTFLTSGLLTLGGKPVLGNNNITLGSSISSISASASNYFQTNGNGKVMSTLANNASRLFPVGNAFYNGVTITNKTNASDTFSVLIKDSVLGNGDTGRQITTPHVKATWDISKNNTNGGNGVDFDFNWDASQEVGGINTFVLNHHNDTVWQIVSGTAGSVSGTTTKTMSHTGYMGRFSPFAFGPGVTPLPVELSKFKATCQSDYIQIDWTTASEIRNKAFELYKSENAQDWKFIHTEAGQGDKATETIYTFKDLDKKTSYYRLKDIDEDGIENWSQIIFSDCKNEVSNIQIYPNPATDYIKVIAPIYENTTLNIISLEGKIIKTMPLISNQTMISVKELTAGIYIIETKGNHNNFLLKFTKN